MDVARRAANAAEATAQEEAIFALAALCDVVGDDTGIDLGGREHDDVLLLDGIELGLIEDDGGVLLLAALEDGCAAAARVGVDPGTAKLDRVGGQRRQHKLVENLELG